MVDENSKNLLDRIADFADHVSSTSSSKAKQQIIAEYATDTELLKAMRYAYSPYKKFNVRQDTLIKKADLVERSNISDVFELLDNLEARTITGHTAIGVVNGYMSQLTERQREALFYILEGDFKMRASTSLINKAIPHTVPTFKVALAQKYDPKRVNFDTETWFLSRKLDGIRCICRKENGVIKFFSRKGLEFLTLSRVAEEVAKIPGDFVLDGEICIVDADGNDDFQGIMKQYKKKDHTIENPMFIVFDMLTLEEFDSEGVGATRLLSERYVAAQEALAQVEGKYTRLLEQLVANDENFALMAEEVERMGWEGSMLRKDIPYEGKRSHNLLKVKTFHDAEYQVVDLEMGPIRWVEDGQDIEVECLTRVMIEHKGNIVGVGSGFSKEQRIHYHENPNELIGKTITVQYFEESVNQKGEISLRFPTLKYIYDGERLI